jgi:uncharacterized protein with HEPN domain
MQRDALYVADLVESSRTVRGYLHDISREQWDEDQVLRDVVLYRMLLLGEIASALPDSPRDRYPDVDWRHIRAFRDLAVHKYFSVDWAVVWQIAQEEVPLLEEQAMGILRAEFPDLAKTYEPETPGCRPWPGGLTQTKPLAQIRASLLTAIRNALSTARRKYQRSGRCHCAI